MDQTLGLPLVVRVRDDLPNLGKGLPVLLPGAVVGQQVGDAYPDSDLESVGQIFRVYLVEAVGRGQDIVGRDQSSPAKVSKFIVLLLKVLLIQFSFLCAKYSRG